MSIDITGPEVAYPDLVPICAEILDAEFADFLTVAAYDLID